MQPTTEPSSPRRAMPGRLLRLLSLLQSRRQWQGPELADRLGVSRRTLRRDVERLRELDYAVQATTGTAGGYRLAAGGRATPALLLDDDEALAAAVALATAAGGAPGIAEGAARALTKLEALLPARLRPHLNALGRAAAALPHRAAVDIGPARLALLAGCCRDGELLAFDYRDRRGTAARRRVEPHHVVTAQGRWYLIAYDPDRADWRTFRADRITDPLPTRRRFTPRPRPLPAPGPAEFLARSMAEADHPHTARLRVDLPADQVRTRLFHTVPGTVAPDGDHRSRVRLAAHAPELVVHYVAAITALGAPVDIDASPEVAERLRTLGRRLAR
ncbi:helix-turn-helix transcriptional regulator [Streptomonospora wellingtoniae]|uniref:WYL domain-containing protein n=1 Tax=Streptomonospora wellingtoniae TaxID=3075544 RepID=A0ABU2KTS4_9ACTN|nr:WYL domain-containing protein [Streptomonospora sp. DSM 45055]MDT0302643.1 WYL domain-containing protein [Streptomonospora sp. DSM 45055]